MPRVFIVTARNSARVIGFSGRNVPSLYHLISDFAAKESIVLSAKDVSVSVNHCISSGADESFGVDFLRDGNHGAPPPPPADSH